MFRISDKDCFLVDVENSVEVEPVIRFAPPGRYHIHEMSTTPLPSGCTARRWGIRIKHADGAIVIEPDPWEK
jgi:hypothetical protein